MSIAAAPGQVASNPFTILGTAAPSRAERGLAGSSPLIPDIPLEDGQQYGFHFDMSKCIGCKCCEVACAEQNNNPSDVSWRRVGEIEGGVYPHTQRLHLSMGCNHCLDPSCMTGCPTRAYTKDSHTGIVLHDADACIGCEYCIWNCPYSVPTFNDERGVVGKCDMCHGRLTEGDAPACVSACPSEALAIEIVDVAEWQRKYGDEANAPGLPSAEDTISTTRITLPEVMPALPEKVDHYRVRQAKPHYSLVLMTVLTQLSIAGFAAAWLLSLFGSTAAALAASVTLALGLAAFVASPLHLGRPAFALLAIRNLRSSWLSREILGLSAFGLAASAYAAMLLAGLPGAKTAGAVASAIGLFAMYATSRIYLVPGRPSWNSAHTVAEFFLTGAMLGPLLLAALGALPADVLNGSAAFAAIGNILVEIWRFLRFVRSEDHERQATAHLLSGPLARLFLLRLGLVAVGAIALPARGLPVAGFALATAGALLGRYLFFVSVVPKNMALPFLERRAAA